jgi:NADH-quinone oxidoreductase subunit N
MWTLDVYEGAPTSVSMILVSLPKIGLLTVLFKFLYIAFFFQLEIWTPVLLCIGLFSILIGGLGGSRQKSLKRLLVYSGIGHIGYIILGIIGGISVRGCYASLFYLFIYILSNLFLWSIYLQWTSTQEQANGSLSSMKDLSLTNSSLSIGTALIWFSLAGIPPLAGFFAKYFVISPAIQEHLYVFALGFLFLSLVSVTYYLKIVKILYFDGANTGHWKKREFALEIPHITGWLLAGILSIIFFFCLNPNPGFLTMYILGLNLFPA